MTLSPGHHDRTRRDHLAEGRQLDTQENIRRLYFFQCPCRLLTKLGIHRDDQGAARCMSLRFFRLPPTNGFLGLGSRGAKGDGASARQNDLAIQGQG